MSDLPKNENKVYIETKVQTIYYENSQGKIKKFYHADNERINNTQAIELLESESLSPVLVLKTIRERIEIEMTRKELQERITHTERFYKR